VLLPCTVFLSRELTSFPILQDMPPTTVTPSPGKETSQQKLHKASPGCIHILAVISMRLTSACPEARLCLWRERDGCLR
jgi:hypothetical protein